MASCRRLSLPDNKQIKKLRVLCVVMPMRLPVECGSSCSFDARGAFLHPRGSSALSERSQPRCIVQLQNGFKHTISAPPISSCETFLRTLTGLPANLAADGGRAAIASCVSSEALEKLHQKLFEAEAEAGHKKRCDQGTRDVVGPRSLKSVCGILVNATASLFFAEQLVLLGLR